MTALTKTVTYDVQRGWGPEWGWHWLIIDRATRENVGLLLEDPKTLELTFDIVRPPIITICDPCGGTRFDEDGYCKLCGWEQ